MTSYKGRNTQIVSRIGCEVCEIGHVSKSFVHYVYSQFLVTSKAIKRCEVNTIEFDLKLKKLIEKPVKTRRKAYFS